MKARAPQIMTVLLLLVMAGLAFWMAQGQAGKNLALESPVQAPLEAESRLAPDGMQAPYRFVAFGDWGAGTSFQKDVAKQLAALYQKEPFDAVLLLGDNIYEFGDVNKYGKAYFTDMYAPLLQAGVNFIVALGNHDVRLNFGEDQLRFFNMPGYYYTVRKNDGRLEIFVLNTNTFAKDQVQQKWLDKKLGGSKAAWKVVMGHHPLYSSGEHGNNPGLIKTLEPLLIKHRADFYLAGHDHDYERFAPRQGVQHIVAGTGGAYLRDFEKPVSGSLVRKKAHGFLNFTLTESMMGEDTLKMQMIDKTGAVLDSAQWHKKMTFQRQAS